MEPRILSFVPQGCQPLLDDQHTHRRAAAVARSHYGIWQRLCAERCHGCCIVSCILYMSVGYVVFLTIALVTTLTESTCATSTTLSPRKNGQRTMAQEFHSESCLKIAALMLPLGRFVARYNGSIRLLVAARDGYTAWSSPTIFALLKMGR